MTERPRVVWDCSRILRDNEGTWAETTPRLQEPRVLPEGSRRGSGSPFDLLDPLGSRGQRTQSSQPGAQSTSFGLSQQHLGLHHLLHKEPLTLLVPP